MTKKTLYSPEVHQECIERIGNLSADTQPEWGSMNPAQMLAHCAEIQEVVNGSKELTGTPFIAKLFKGFIRKAVVSDKPFRRSLQTHPQYKQTSALDFETQKQRLIEALDVFAQMDKDNVTPPDHALFGPMTRQERGWSMYKHLDHHLTQFGV